MRASDINARDWQMRALLEGRKTQARLVVTPQPEPLGHSYSREWRIPVAGGYDMHLTDEELRRTLLYPCNPGDLLWVREAWCEQGKEDYGLTDDVAYRADHPDAGGQFVDEDGVPIPGSHWRRSIHMPRWASRLTLNLTNVRVERLQEVSEQDAWAQGAPRDSAECPFPITKAPPGSNYLEDGWDCARDWFADTWDPVNAKRGYSWACNPWVWALTFDVIHANVEEVLSNPKFYLPRTRPQQVDAYAKARGRAM